MRTMITWDIGVELEVEEEEELVETWVEEEEELVETWVEEEEELVETWVEEEEEVEVELVETSIDEFSIEVRDEVRAVMEDFEDEVWVVVEVAAFWDDAMA
jgi:hypothetical protein